MSGAVLEVASGAASTIPVGGTLASLGIDALLAAKDVKGEMDELNVGVYLSIKLFTV